MINVFDYLANESLYPFSTKPFNEVDNAVMVSLAYLQWEGIVDRKPVKLSLAGRKYFEFNHDDYQDRRDESTRLRRIMLGMIMESTRYRNMKLMDYVTIIDQQKEMQFSAITIDMDNGYYYVAFRGTDNLLVSWKENFNMTYMSPVPAQTMAEQYLNDILKKYRRKQFYVGGHSKGGNLAVYAAVSSGSNRILKVFNNDGPGFNENFVNSSKYDKMRDRMVSYMSTGSVIGMLMNNNMDCEFVKSSVSGLAEQHQLLTWQTDDHSFVRMQGRSNEGEFFGRGMNDWYQSLSIEEREVFINSVYEAITSLNIETVDQLMNHKMDIMLGILKNLHSYDRQTKSIMYTSFLELLKASGSSFMTTFVVKRLNSFLNESAKEEKKENGSKKTGKTSD